MSQRALELARKRARLQLRSAELRQALAKHATGLSPLASLTDAGATGISWLRRHPEWIVGAAAVLLLVFGPKRMLGYGARIWGLSQLFLGLRHSLLELASHVPRFLFRRKAADAGGPPPS